MNFGLYFCACGESYVSDFPFQVANCLHCHQEMKREDHITQEQIESLTDKQLEHVWRLFKNTPIKNLDEIEEPYLIWDKGTNRFDIWKWFDQHHSKGVGYLWKKWSVKS